MTWPYFGRAALHGGERVNVVTKFCSEARRFDPPWMAREFAGASFARLCGLLVPEPYLLRLLPETRNVLSNEFKFEVYGDWCLGSEAYRPLTNIMSTTDVYSTNKAEAQLLLIVDMILLNDDRGDSNPNMALFGGRIFAFDFGAAFPAAGSTERDFDRSLSSNHLREIFQGHRARPRKAVSARTFQNATDKVFHELAPACDMIMKLIDEVPEDFHDALKTAGRYLEYVLQNEIDFRQRIKEVL